MTDAPGLDLKEPAYQRVFGRPRPRWLNIPAHRPFVEDLAKGLVDMLAPIGPEALSDAIVLTPTRRGGRSLTEAFVRAAEGRATLLPQIRALGDLEERRSSRAISQRICRPQSVPCVAGLSSPVSSSTTQTFLSARRSRCGTRWIWPTRSAGSSTLSRSRRCARPKNWKRLCRATLPHTGRRQRDFSPSPRTSGPHGWRSLASSTPMFAAPCC